MSSSRVGTLKSNLWKPFLKVFQTVDLRRSTHERASYLWILGSASALLRSREKSRLFKGRRLDQTVPHSQHLRMMEWPTVLTQRLPGGERVPSKSLSIFGHSMYLGRYQAATRRIRGGPHALIAVLYGVQLMKLRYSIVFSEELRAQVNQ